MALSAAGFELLAVGTEYVQKHYRSVTMSSRGAAVALGGIKLFAGVLGSFGAGVGAVYDFVVDAPGAWRKGRPGIAIAIGARGAAQGVLAILGTAVGYSFCGPLFELLAKRASSQLGAGLAQGLARGAYWLVRPAAGAAVARVAILIRVVGSVTWVSIGLTILLFVVADNALESWCDKSSFRANPKPSDDGLADEGRELEGLYLAFNEVK